MALVVSAAFRKLETHEGIERTLWPQADRFDSSLFYRSNQNHSVQSRIS